MRRATPFFAALVLCLSSLRSSAQDGYFPDWLKRVVSATQAAQPHWVTPLATTTPRLEAGVPRRPTQWQAHNSRVCVTTDNYGGG